MLGRRTGLSRPNGVTTSYSYDNLSRLLQALHQDGSTLVESAAYPDEAAGNRLTRTETTPGSKHGQTVQKTAAYTYDAIYPLTHATVNGQYNVTADYTYDAVANRLTDQFGGTYSYNQSKQLLGHSAHACTYDE